MPKDMVTFLMPDGTEVSNDPEFGLKKALQEQLDSTEYSGDAGIPEDEQKAQTQVERMASLQSGQPGVGENATVDDPVKDAYGPLGTPAMQRQEEDVKKAQEAGASPKSTSVEDPEPVDSNEKVAEAREAKKKAREAARKAMEKLGEEGEGDPEKPYSEWSAAQLKAELLKRNAGRDEADQIDTKGLKNKGDVAKALEADDETQAENVDNSGDNNQE